MRFFVRLVFFIAPALLLWLVAAPIMNIGVTHTTDVIVRICDYHDLIKNIRPSGTRIIISFAAGPDVKSKQVDYRQFSFSFVVLLALIMAVPDLRPQVRIKILLLAMVLLFPVHVFRVVVSILNFYGQSFSITGKSIYPFFYQKSLYYVDRVATVLDGYLTAVIIWFGLMFYYKWQYRYFKKAAAA